MIAATTAPPTNPPTTRHPTQAMTDGPATPMTTRPNIATTYPSGDNPTTTTMGGGDSTRSTTTDNTITESEIGGTSEG